MKVWSSLCGGIASQVQNCVSDWSISVRPRFGIAVHIRHRDADTPRWELQSLANFYGYALAGVRFAMVQSAAIHSVAVPASWHDSDAGQEVVRAVLWA